MADHRAGDGGDEIPWLPSTSNFQQPTPNSQPRAPSVWEFGAGSWEFARALILQRRSALAFDARSALPRERFVAMLAKLQSSARRLSMRSIGRRTCTSRSSCTASKGSFRASTPTCATRRSSTNGGRPCGRSFSGSRLPTDLFLLLPTDVSVGRQSRVVRSGDRERRLLQPWHDCASRVGAARSG